ncbi:MAG: PD40 domain-containing protein [Acidobacteria bacterium]|nr:PD40 domain-containing protein [Acidobacteriota bacterium]
MTHEFEAPPPGPPVEYVFGPFRLDVASLQLWRGDEIVALTPKAFDTLVVLIRNRHRLVRKDELMTAVWANSFVSEDSLTQNITALRRALGDDHHQPGYITTIPRRGYRFIAPVTERPESGERAVAAAAAPAAPAAESPSPLGTGEAASPAPVAVRGTTRWRWTGVAAATVAAVLLLLFNVVDFPRAAPSVGSLRFTIGAPPGTRLASGGALSPDSRYLAFVAEDDPSGVTRLWVRDLKDGQSQPIDGSEGAVKPFWSPDSQFIGFFAKGSVKRVPLNGGPVQTLASTVGLTVAGGTWGSGDLILFSSYRSAVSAVPAAGGDATPVTELDASARETAHRWPHFLPDGRHFLFSIYAEDQERQGTYVGEIGRSERTRLIPDIGGVYAPPGYLLFVRDRVLIAQPFDASSMRVSGSPTPIAGDVFPPTATGGAMVSASAGDLLTFGGRDAETRLVWFDRAGKPLDTIRAPTTLHNPTLSPDGRYLLAGSGIDVWLVDLERDAHTRIVPGNTPLLSPNAEQIAFTSGRIDGVADIYIRSTFGRSDDQLLLRSKEHKIVNDWSRDGRYLVYASTSTRTKMDLWVVPTFGERAPMPLLATPFNEFQGQVSPDGRWIAYASDESGIWEVYVQSFPVPGAKRAVSSGGASEPQWRPDGRELFYLTADGMLMSVDVRPGEALQLTRPRPLFQTPVPTSGEMNTRRNHYAVSPDGQRLLIDAASDIDSSITVQVNWRAGIRP